MSQLHIIENDGCALHIWSHGRDDAPPVLLSHGATLDHESWAPQIEALAAHYRVLTWDLRGHGLSQPLDGKFTMERGAADIQAILDHFGIETVALVGLSIGSYISQRFVYEHPERVGALVSFDATSLTGFRIGPVMRWLLSISDRLMGLYSEKQLVEAIAKGAAIRPDVQAYIRRVSAPLGKRKIIDIWSAVQTGLTYMPAYQEPVPLMIALGEKDTVGMTAKGAHQWAAQRPTARFEIIPDAGHCANQDNPEHSTRILLDFLGQHWAEQRGA